MLLYLLLSKVENIKGVLCNIDNARNIKCVFIKSILEVYSLIGIPFEQFLIYIVYDLSLFKTP